MRIPTALVYRLALVSIVAALVACGGSEGGGDSEAGAGLGADALVDGSGDQVGDDAGLELGAELDVDAVADLPDATEPPVFSRAEAGEPLTDAEVTAVTELYLELLREARWFEVTDERVHGWPRSDPEGRYWYGTYWGGVKVEKENGEVTFLHPEDGADNNGMRTGPILASVCFAQALWGNQTPLLHKLVRGFNSWGMCMERESLPEQDVLVARSHYPVSVTSTDDGRTIHIDYSLNRPGVNLDEAEPPTLYVHNPDNPHWGDIWIKNKRSKDDVGHMLQALGYLPSCTADAGVELATDVAAVEDLYGRFFRRIEDEDWRIITVTEDWEAWHPFEDLAFYVQSGGTECSLMLASRLYGRGDPGELDCGDGISVLDEQWALKNDYHQIHRSFHEAAILLARRHGHDELADTLLAGMAWRLDKIFDAREAAAAGGPAYTGSHDKDVAELVSASAAVGLPLTWREVRFLHDRVREAHEGYLSQGLRPHLNVFDEATPDGSYAYNPDAPGFFWRYLAHALGTCASPYTSTTSKPALDCDLVRQGL